eukprot:2652848-Amphidinium_carterae.1
MVDVFTCGASQSLPKVKHLKKIGTNLHQLKEDCIAKEKDIQPMVQKESDHYLKQISDFEQGMKTYQSGLRKEVTLHIHSPTFHIVYLLRDSCCEQK